MAARLLQGRLTVEDYYRLAELGILGEDDRVELEVEQSIRAAA